MGLKKSGKSIDRGQKSRVNVIVRDKKVGEKFDRVQKKVGENFCREKFGQLT